MALREGDIIYMERNESKLVRPKIKLWRAALIIGGILLLGAAAGLCVCALSDLLLPEIPSFIYVIIAVLFALLTLAAFILRDRKRFVIFCIRLYQKFAPEYVRRRCVFTPTCSEYMILAIEKYGLSDGIRRGRERMDRCHFPNGGEDWP